MMILTLEFLFEIPLESHSIREIYLKCELEKKLLIGRAVIFLKKSGTKISYLNDIISYIFVCSVEKRSGPHQSSIPLN